MQQSSIKRLNMKAKNRIRHSQTHPVKNKPQNQHRILHHVSQRSLIYTQHQPRLIISTHKPTVSLSLPIHKTKTQSYTQFNNQFHNIKSSPLNLLYRSFATPNIDPRADPFPSYTGSELRGRPIKRTQLQQQQQQQQKQQPLPYYTPPPPDLIEPDETDSNEYDETDIDNNSYDPNAYRLVIPNRYSIEDFLLDKTQRMRQRIQLDANAEIDEDGNLKRPSITNRLRTWRTNRQLQQFEDEDTYVRGIDSDLELYGGINLEKYNEAVYQPSKHFENTIIQIRSIPESQIGKQLTPGVPLPIAGVSLSTMNNITKKTQAGTQWSQMIGNYAQDTNSSITTSGITPSTPIEDKTILKKSTLGSEGQTIVSGRSYLKERLKERFPEIAAIIDPNIKSDQIHIDELSPLTKKQQYENITQIQVPTKQMLQDNNFSNSLLPPSRQSPSSYSFSPRDAYETQMFIIHRMKTDDNLRLTLQRTFRHYTKEMDPITGIEACRHLLSIELYLYLRTLEDNGIKLGFDNFQEHELLPKQSVWDKLTGKGHSMSTASVLAMAQHYRTKYLQMVLQDDSGELLHALEEEWIELLNCVADINPEIIRNAYIDKSTAYKLLRELYLDVSSQVYVDDFEDQMNCILIQFAKQRREHWDGNAYNSWKENRLAQLNAIALHYEKEQKYDQVKAVQAQIRQIELIGDDAENAEQINNDKLINEIVQDLDMTKLKLYINSALLFYYRTQVYSEYGFEDDVGALLMTKALHSIPDMNIVYYMDDITDMANRVRDFEMQQNQDDNDNDDEYLIDDFERDEELRKERELQKEYLKERFDPNYNENFSSGFKGWFKNKLDKDPSFNSTHASSSISYSNKQQSDDIKLKQKTKLTSPPKRKFDQYGLPIVQPPTSRTSQYSSTVTKYHGHQSPKH